MDIKVLWLYEDSDSFLLLNNPPENLSEILTQWNDLDNRYLEGEIPESEWMTVNDWLRKHGVEIIDHSETTLWRHRKEKAQ